MLSLNKFRSVALKHDIFSTNNYNIVLNTKSLEKPASSFLYSSVNRNLMSTARNFQDQQSKLELMPVPKLSNSIDKFLKAVKPLIDEKDFENTKQIAGDFAKKGGVGEKLQKLLEDRAKTTDNWLSQWWLEKVYLEPRYSLIISCNPATLYPHGNYKTTAQQLSFATKYIMGFLSFRKHLNELPTDKMGKSDLCMDQYFKLIGSCRVPKQSKDEFIITKSEQIDFSVMRHVTIMYKNHIFKLEVLKENGVDLPEMTVYNNLKYLVESVKEDDIGLGAMTAAHRDNWFEVYNELSMDENNRKNFESIQNSLFVLCLDGEEKNKKNEINDRSIAIGEILHGNKEFTANRWFDKTIQVIVGSNGVWGTNFEHSLAEAIPHSYMNDYIYKNILHNKKEYESEVETESSTTVTELKFTLSKDTFNTIQNTKLLTDKLIDNLELFVLNFEDFGKNFPKSQKISPDAFVQIAMQLAFYKMHKKIPNAYETGALRKFHLGRTDIIRTCGEDSIKFIQSMLSNYPLIERNKLLLKAIESHIKMTQSVLNFESFDRHLFGLKQIALENNIELHELYQGKAFQKANHFYISSSQISSKFQAVTCYGPLVDDGYGSSYNMMEKRLIFGISALKSCKETNAELFGMNLRQSLLDCQSVILNINSKL